MTTHDQTDTDPAQPDDFWGDQADWPAVPPSERADRAGLRRRRGGSPIGRWWDSLLGGGATADRSHGSAAPASLDEYGALDDQDPGVAPGDTEDAWDIEAPPQPVRRPGVDPLLARFGGLAVIVTLAIPAVLALTSGADNEQLRTAAPPIFAATAVPMVASSPVESTTNETAAVGTAPSATPAPSAAAPATTSETIEPATTTSEATPVAALVANPEPTQPASTGPATTVDACGAQYELARGDYWIRIADSADVSLADLLDVNNATVDTLLVPGRSICLPLGAATPSPPPAPTTVAPATTAPSTRRPAATTSTPTPTTKPTPAATIITPTTTAPPAPAAVSAAEAEGIIRSVWPDELEDRAIAIAERESNLRSNAKNYCCYGLFQIHWIAHRSWLSQIGVSSAAKLFDPTTNAQAAYTLYQRSGGFGPWGG